MPEQAGTTGSSRRSPRTALPYAVLAAALALTCLGTAYVAMSVRARDQLRFDAAIHRVEERIENRMATYTAILRAADGLFAARWPVYPKEFADFAARLELRKNYPGVFGLGLSSGFLPQHKDNFIQFMQNAVGYKDFKVWPASAEDQLSSIIYLEPKDDRNAKAVGFDMYTDPTRRAAMQRARDTGQPAASGKVVLVQDVGEVSPTPGFLIYVPVYTGGLKPATPEARLRDFRGWVYCPFRSNDLFGDVFAEELGSGLEVRIFDGHVRDDAALLYQTAESQAAAVDSRSSLESVRPMEIAGRPWTVVMAAGPGFFWWPVKYLPTATALVGLALSASLFALVNGQVRARLRAERIMHDLRASQEEVRRNEAKFRRLMDANLVGVAFTRPTGEVLEANDAYLRATGHTRDQLRSGQARWDRATPPEYRAVDARGIEQLHQRGVCDPYEKEYARPDGSRVPVMVGIASLDAGVEQSVVVAVDLTEIKRAQRAMQEAKESAEAATRLKDEFLATVSHELRTPLNAILGWAQLLAGEGGTSSLEDTRQGVETILRNARVQAQLIEDLLDISRIVSGKLRLEARSVDLATVVRAAIASVGLAAEAKGVGLVDDVGAETALVWGDPDRLQQVFWNLLSNSIKFTDRGGSIRVALRNDGGYAHVTVVDTGLGIDTEFLPYVFERFRQADATLTRKYGGLGLGLSIVRNLVEMHGGSVGVQSEGKSRGTTFTVSLPIRAGTPPRPVGIPRGDGADGNGKRRTTLAGVKVLVVDDDPDTRELVQHVLAAQHAEVVTAATATRALEVLRSQEVGVLVSDLAMPDEDGYELIRMVRELPPKYGGHVPAVALSALTRVEERERAIAAGFQVHLPKPVDAGALAAIVAELGRK